MFLFQEKDAEACLGSLKEAQAGKHIIFCSEYRSLFSILVQPLYYLPHLNHKG